MRRRRMRGGGGEEQRLAVHISIARVEEAWVHQRPDMLLTKKNDQKKIYMIIYIIIKNILCMVQYRRRDSVFLASHVYVKTCILEDFCSSWYDSTQMVTPTRCYSTLFKALWLQSEIPTKLINLGTISNLGVAWRHRDANWIFLVNKCLKENK